MVYRLSGKACSGQLVECVKAVRSRLGLWAQDNAHVNAFYSKLSIYYSLISYTKN